MLPTSSAAGPRRRPPAPARARPGLALVAGLGAGCAGKGDSGAGCPEALSVEALGAVQDTALDEISGLAASEVHPGTFWAVEDKVGPARLVALGADGAVQGVLRLDGVDLKDAEDLALVDGLLIVADTGDNEGVRASATLWRVPEPAALAAEMEAAAEPWTFTLPGGPRDIEALLAPDRDGAAYLIAKAGDGGPVFEVPAGGGAAAEVGAVDLGGAAGQVSGGGVDPRTGDVWLRTGGALLLYPGAAGSGLLGALGAPPCPLEAPDEPNPEAVAPVDGGVVLVSEGAGASLWEVRAG